MGEDRISKLEQDINALERVLLILASWLVQVGVFSAQDLEELEDIAQDLRG